MKKLAWLFVAAFLFCSSFGGFGYQVIKGGGVTAAPAGGGAVSYDSAGSVAHVEANTTLNVTPPAGDAGDYLVLACSDDVDQAISDLDGFTLITSRTSSTSRLSVAGMTDAGAASYDIIVPATTELSCVIARFTKTSGTWTVNDFDSAAASGADVTCPDLTVSQDDSMFIVFGGNDDPYAFDETPTGTTQFATYSAADPTLVGYYQAVDTGTVTGKTLGNSAGGDISVVGIILEAQ